MSDVFVSYKREDQSRVERICRALSAGGLSVWWDREIGGGEAWRERIEQELDTARCVVVVWSRRSVGKDGAFVKDEAGRGLRRNVLLPVRIHRVDPPIGFGECQTLDLVGWKGRPKDRRILDVIASVEAIVHQKTLPKLQWPLRRLRRRIFSTIGTLLFATMVLIAMVPALRESVCTAPAIGRICEQLGYAPPLKMCFAWEPAAEKYPYVIRKSEMPSSDDAEAKAAALNRARKEAASMACPAPKNDRRKLVSAHIEPLEWRCSDDPDGRRCGFDGQVVCQYQNRMIAYGDECR